MKSVLTLKVAAFLFTAVCIGVAAIDPPANGHFKNLKVLPKNIPEDSLFTLMDGYNASLGVDCGYCHAKDKKADTMMFASDAKSEKEIARNMIRMTMDINNKYFGFNAGPISTPVTVVTCTTCHRGEPMPTK